MRQRAAESDVVIVNHHLLCADASVRKSAYGEVIPSCATLVVDEAHQLEDVATQYFGVAFSNYRVDDLRPRRASACWRPRRSSRNQAETLARALTRVSTLAHGFFTGLSLGAQREPAEARARYTADTLGELAEDGAGADRRARRSRGDARADRSGRSIRSDPDALVRPSPDPRRIATLQRRAGELRNDLRFLLRADDPDFVYYLEARGRGVLPARVADRRLAHRPRSRCSIATGRVVLTSATLAVDGSFAYVKGRLGLRDADEMRVPSEFDFRTQALLYLPRRMPPPKSPVVRRGRGARGDRAGDALAGPRVRAVHELHGAARGQAVHRDGAALSRAGAGHGAALGAARRVPLGRRTPSCWPRPASGRAWTSSATR